MAENDGFDRDHLAVTAGTNFSQLLFAEDDASLVGLDVNQTFNFASSSAFSAADKPPKMLCFGNYPYSEQLVFSDTTRTSQKSGVTCSDSSSTSSSNRLSFITLSKPNKKRNGSDQESVQSTSDINTHVVASQKTSKRTKTENPSSTVPAKRKEKLGERITALQQLVSPFGKSDTASVLHEAMGYIKFLQDQVQVLCSPYLQRLPTSLPEGEGGENGDRGKARNELKSRGLCLVPVEWTVHVENNNGADLWSPAMSNDDVSLSTQQ